MYLGQFRKIRVIVGLTRAFRHWHRRIAIVAAFFLILVALTGLLLAFKQETGLLPSTKHAGKDIHWLSVDSFIGIAKKYTVEQNLLQNPEIDRIDLRPGDGIAKITFVRSFLEIQINGQTGEVVSSATRYADVIEKIHDGSVFDFVFEPRKPVFTWLFSGFTGISLLVLAVTGIFLWVNPLVIRHWKKKYHGEPKYTDSKNH